MNSDQIFTLIEEIAATPSKNEKQALVAANASDVDFKRVLNGALNPFLTYGIAKRPSSTTPPASVRAFDADTWRVLDELATRELSGNAAIAAVQNQLETLSPNSAELFWRIVSKDLRAGFGENTVNKVIKGLIPDFPYMRCCLPKDAKLDKFDWKTGVVSQEKADGMFINLDHEVGGVTRITSRQGSPFPLDQFAGLLSQVQTCITPGTQMHGEMIVLKGSAICSREIGNGILNSIQNGGKFADDETPIYLAWDQIPLSAVVTKGKYEVGYKRRLEALTTQLDKVVASYAENAALWLIPTRIVHSFAEAHAHYAEFLARGKEGTVFKNPSAFWKDGTSKEQVKLKLEVAVELVVVGFNEGTGKNVGSLGSLKCQSSDGLLVVDVSGRGDDMRRNVWDNQAAWLGAIVTVKANGVMPGDPKSLFLPIFVERRTDKSEADSLPQIEAQFAAAIAGEQLKEAA